MTAKNWLKAVLIVLLAVNVFAFCLMGADKFRATHGMRRVRERTLWLGAAAFGAPGAWAGMLVFRHKTQKPPFPALMPALSAVQALAVGFLFYRFRKSGML